jgi:hypothetical protein
MSKDVYDWMKQWSDLVNKEIPQEDFWIETPVGRFKNPKFIPEESEFDNEINITIKYDEWDKTIESYGKDEPDLLNEAYNNYESQQTNYYIPIYPKEKFVNKIKTDKEFSEKWGLKIEERELSLEERHYILTKTKLLIPISDDVKDNWIETLNEKNIPTKLITLTYNDKTIESYE